MIGGILPILILCMALVPLGQQNGGPSLLYRGLDSVSLRDDLGPAMLMSTPAAAASVQTPSASFTFSPSSPAAGYPVDLNATANGGIAPYTFLWNFGDGANGTGNPVTHVYASGGSFNVTLVVKDNTGAALSTYKLIPVKYDVPPVAAFAWTPTVVFSGETVFFDASGSYDPDGVIISHLWQLGDGESQTGIGILHTYSSPGVYEVTLSVEDDSGVTVVKPLAVWIHPAMSLSASSNTTQGLAPLAILFNAQVSGGQSPYTFSWDFGDGLTSARPSPIHNYTISRVYRVEVTVTDSLNHSATQDMNITVTAGPIELSFLGVSETTLKVGGILTAMSAFPLMIFMLVRRRK